MYARWPSSSCRPCSDAMSSATCGRQESGELGSLALHGLDEAGVRDGDRSLIGERLHQIDLLVGERPGHVPARAEHADQLLVEHDRDADERAKADEGLRAEGVVGILQDVRDLHDVAREAGPPHGARAVQ